ncbi:MAG TPA: hypothetical protein VKA08_09120, partial [Balneolales bacterium]|nr:hypothetical protein [Balneolales bacterium]
MIKEPFEERSVYHIYNRANGEANVFRESKNYDFFLQKYYKYVQPVAETYAFCLMPNHFHMMIRVRGVEELDAKTFRKFRTFGMLGKVVSRQFASLFSSYTQAYNKLYGRTGSLFQPNMKRKKVTDESYFTQLILYIHNNPVKHGFVRDLYDWPYSSVHWFTNGRQQRRQHSKSLE